MRGCGLPVFLDPGDLRLEQGNAGGELALRLGGQVLAGQLAGGVASRAWTRVIFH